MREKIDLARGFTEQSPGQRQALMKRVADLATEGQVEYYKKV
jgi:hypothetical protein